MQQPSTASPLARETARLLGTSRFGRSMQAHDEVTSTNTLAAAWAAQGAPEGSVVVAEHQTAGRGRLGRAWQANAGQNLTFSVLMRPALPPERLSLITLAASVAVSDAIAHFTTPQRPAIKWPNDLLLEDRKCCGMLLETALSPGARATVVLGVGINVNQSHFPPELQDRATSLLLATGRAVPRAALFAEVLLQLEHRYDQLCSTDGGATRALYEARLHGQGAPATLYVPGGTVRGILQGITDTGALRLLTPSGPRTFHAGEVSSDAQASLRRAE